MEGLRKLEKALWIDERPAQETKKRKLRGPARTPYPVSSEFAKLSDAEQTALLDKTVQLSTSALQSIDEIVGREGREADAVLSSVIADMGRTKDLPLRQQYVEMGLWRRVQAFSERSRRLVENACSRLETAGDEDDQTAKGASSFRDFYMAEMTTNFSSSLDAVREDGDLDASKVELLVRCLEAGIDIFSDADKRICLTKRMQKATSLNNGAQPSP